MLPEARLKKTRLNPAEKKELICVKYEAGESRLFGSDERVKIIKRGMLIKKYEAKRRTIFCAERKMKSPQSDS